MRFSVVVLGACLAIVAFDGNAGAQTGDDMAVPETADEPTDMIEIDSDSDIAITPEPMPATPQPALTNAQPRFDDTSLKKARVRMGYCGGAIGLGSVAVVLSYFAGSSSCHAQDGKCSDGRIGGLVLGGTAIIGGFLGMIPAAISLRREKELRDQRIAFDPAKGAFVF